MTRAQLRLHPSETWGVGYDGRSIPMPLAELQLPVRLPAGGGPCAPDARVLRALMTPVIGQFDPAFTAVMDDVVKLARATFLTDSPHCFAISALASGGLEAVLNSLVEEDTTVAVHGSPSFVSHVRELVQRLHGCVVAADEPTAEYVLAPFVDPYTGVRTNVQLLAARVHAIGAKLIIEATHGLAAQELRVDDWALDVCVAGADHAVGAPSGLSLVTYSPEIDQRMRGRARPPRTSYLDLLQLQAYWSPERLNHHTAPTSLVFALREALRLVQLEGLSARWRRHAITGRALHDGLRALGLVPTGDPPYALVQVPSDEPWRRLIDDFGVHVARIAPRTWRLGLLGADARTEAVQYVLSALAEVLSA